MMRSVVVMESLVNVTEKVVVVVGGDGDEVDIQKRLKLVLPVHGGGNSGDNHMRHILWRQGHRKWRLVMA
jgi:hypothetical protein